jgi:alpha-L-rhamnosidase
MPRKSPQPDRPVKLRCDKQINPVGLGNTHPTLTWQLPPGVKKVLAWEIEAARSPAALRKGQADLWKSGKVSEAWATGSCYAGTALSSRETVFWRVRIWDNARKASPWSAVARFEMGLLEPADWSARWIAAEVVGSRRTRAPAPHLRHAFQLAKPVRKARLHIAARGLYVCEINGQPVSADELAPGWTDYRKRIPARCYDVTDLLASGENAIGATLGDGWYCGRIAWKDRQYYGERPSLLAQLEIEHTDGSTTRVVTDESWKWKTGALLENDLVTGESYDARLELGQWSSPGFDDGSWLPCVLKAAPDGRVEPARGLPVRAQDHIQPVYRIEADCSIPGGEKEAWIYDLGQNFSGRIQVTMTGRRGAVVRFRYGEMLEAPDRVYVENLRTAEATDFYTLAGHPDGETWKTCFTFHGFRYVEVCFPVASVRVDSLEGVALHNELAKTGDFSCSHPLINQLQSNILWGQKSNFLEAPTDCPQRDERLGWTGDAQVFARTAAFNCDVQVFFRKWAQDLRDAQNETGRIPTVIPWVMTGDHDAGPAWSDAQVICPWTMYLSYGDKQILADHYDSMKRYVDHLINDRSIDWIRSHPDLEGFLGFGDWLALDGSKDNFGNTPKDLIGTAYLAHDLGLMAKIAGILGESKDAARFTDWQEQCEAAFNARFVTPRGQVLGGTQTSYVLALHFDLLPEEKRPFAVQELVRDIKGRDFHLSTGFVGTPYICHVLTRFGHLDIAYRLVEQESFPSWLLPVRNGATTMWERWNSWTPENGFGDVSMNSFNHYAYGAVGDWLYSTAAGLDFDEAAPGYQAVRFHPRPGGSLTRAQARLDSPRGRVSIKWATTGNRLTVDLTVPGNTEATLQLPPEWTPATPGRLRRTRLKPHGTCWKIDPGRQRLEFFKG